MLKTIILSAVMLLLFTVPVMAEEYLYNHLNDESLKVNLDLSFNSQFESGQIPIKSDWSKTDTYLELTFIAVTIWDIQQSKNGIHHGGKEVNPIVVGLIGERPTDSDFDKLAIGWIFTHFIVSRILPINWRKYWNYITIGWTVYDITTSKQY